MKMRKYFLLALISFLGLKITAQSTDLARIEYTYFPQKNSDNSFRRFRALAAYPIALKKEGSYLVPGIEYRKVQFKLPKIEKRLPTKLHEYSDADLQANFDRVYEEVKSIFKN